MGCSWSQQWKGRTLKRGPYIWMTCALSQAESPAVAAAGAGASDEDDEPESPDEPPPSLLEESEDEAESEEDLLSSFSTGRFGLP